MSHYYDDYRVEAIPLDQIDWGERARQDYKDVAKLARRIEEKGLLNPITLYEKQEDNALPYLLMAGGR